MNGLLLLRQEFPALGMVLGFIPSTQRAPVADIMLLWLELRRATQASEAIVAATRIAWWRDALEHGDGKGVPLAENLIAAHDSAQLTKMLGQLVEATLTEGPAQAHHHTAATLLAQATQQDETELAAALIRLDAILDGEMAGNPGAAIPHPLPALIHWLCDQPTRLAYPERHPMLAFSMLLAAIKL